MRPYGFSFGEPRGELVDDLFGLSDAIAIGHDSRHREGQLLGSPPLMRGDPLSALAMWGAGDDQSAERSGLGWSVLWIDSLDGELLTVGLPTDDLAAGRFDRAQAVSDFE